jgi:hypothetical protein
MALVGASEADVEAHRILAAATHFEVLQLDPNLATAAVAKERHAAARATLVTRQSIGAPHITRATAALDSAFAALGDPALLQRQRELAAAARRDRAATARELELVHRRTIDLEERARQLTASQQTS